MIFQKGKKSVLTLVQTFCEMCITTYKDNTHLTNLADYGTPVICVFYAKIDIASTYQIFKPKTKKKLTQDVTFLQNPTVSTPW